MPDWFGRTSICVPHSGRIRTSILRWARGSAGRCS
jgi:hypothetical protein